MYGFSEYWYTLDDILHVGGVYKEEKFMRAAKEFCGTDWQILSDRFKSGEFPAADQHRSEEYLKVMKLHVNMVRCYWGMGIWSGARRK